MGKVLCVVLLLALPSALVVCGFVYPSFAVQTTNRIVGVLISMHSYVIRSTGILNGLSVFKMSDPAAAQIGERSKRINRSVNALNGL